MWISIEDTRGHKCEQTFVGKVHLAISQNAVKVCERSVALRTQDQAEHLPTSDTGLHKIPNSISLFWVCEGAMCNNPDQIHYGSSQVTCHMAVSKLDYVL